MLLTITGRRRAEKLIENGWFDGMVSISLNEDERVRGRTGHDLLLTFRDSWPGRGRTSALANRGHIDQIMEWSVTVGDDHWILVHCARGISRSTATGMILYSLNGHSPGSAVRKVFASNPKANPNSWLLHLYREETGVDLLCHAIKYRLKGPYR